MEKPKCKLCGERHWANERHAGSAEDGRKLDAVFRNVIPASPELLPPRIAVGDTVIMPDGERHTITLVMPKTDSSTAAKQPKRKTQPRNPKSAAVASHQPSQLTPEEITDIKARRAEANASAKAVVQAAGVTADPRLPVTDQLAPPEKFDRIAYQREYMRKRREAVRLTKPLD